MTKVWFITGCSTGFGRALAERLVDAGAHVAASARDPRTLDALVARAPERVLALGVDVTKAGEVDRGIAAAVERFGGLDVVVNNAGAGLIGALEELGADQILRNFDVNLMGPIRVIRAALPHLRARGRGHLITMSAAAAIQNYPGFSIYGGAKAGLEGVHEALAQELAPLGVRVTLLVPGPFRTDFVGRSLTRAASRNPAYAGTAGRFEATITKLNGTQPGDPMRAAEVIMKLAEMDRPPLRAFLGKYAIAKVKKKLEAVRGEVEVSEGLGGTEFA